jgi:Fe-S-cluster-containing dehydrogenase component
VLACPFGVPKMHVGFELMMKCDMCYDRTSIGRSPMCATVCPSRALHYGTWEQIEELRPRSVPQNRFRFGNQEVRTKVYMMVPRDTRPEYLDVISAMTESPIADVGATGVTQDDEDLMLSGLYRIENGD